MRQAVITVYSATGPGEYDSIGNDIVFRQPYHDFGLAFTFNFTRAFYQYESDCDITISNVNDEILNYFSFDPLDYRMRPKVEIRAGESDVRIKSINEIANLKESLPLIYTGIVYYFSNDRDSTGFILYVNLTDIEFMDQLTRLQGGRYDAGQSVISVIENIIRQLPGVSYDISRLQQSSFSTVVLERDLLLTGELILSGALKRLASQYRFSYHKDSGSTIVFTLLDIAENPGDPTIISSETGLVGYPNSISWDSYIFQTFFGKPGVFFPGDWVQIESPTLTSFGLIIEGQYNFNDTEASISYIVNPSGEPIDHFPVLR